MTEFISTESQRGQALRLVAEHDLPFKMKLTKGGRRTIEQNAYLWGVCYQAILDSGLRDDGWQAEDVHEFLLGSFHGWTVLEGFGKKRMKPIERSSGKSISEFIEYVDFVIQKAAEMGIVIPDAT